MIFEQEAKAYLSKVELSQLLDPRQMAWLCATTTWTLVAAENEDVNWTKDYSYQEGMQEEI